MKASWFDVVIEWVITVIYATLLVVGALQVFGRYFLDTPYAWTEELDIYLFIWLVFLGAAHGMTKSIHPRVTFLVERLPEKAQRVVQIFIDCLTAAMLVVIVIYGLKMVMISRNAIAPATGVSIGYVMYLALPVAAVLMLLNLARRRWSRPQPSDNEKGRDAHP